MKTIEDVFVQQDLYQLARRIECNPFENDDALSDAQLLDTRVCPTSNRAALLFEMRTAECFAEGNAAILVTHGIRSFNWQGAPTGRPLTAFSVQEFENGTTVGGGVRLNFGFFPDGELTLEADRADFYLLQVADISEAPPNYLERRFEEVRSELPWWNSPCSVLQSCTTSIT